MIFFSLELYSLVLKRTLVVLE